MTASNSFLPRSPRPSSEHRLTLSQGFELRKSELIALVGAGGKSTLLFALGRELSAAGYRVLATTTTHMAREQVTGAPTYCLLENLESLAAALRATRFCLVIADLGTEKARGVPASLPARLLARKDVDYVLVEADGARTRPVKAPAAHEPVIPTGASLLVPVVGIDALEGPIEQVAHRPHRVSALTGRGEEAYLSPEDVAQLLVHPQGGLKNVPAEARVIPFINKVESESQLVLAEQIARPAARNRRIVRVLAGSARSQRPIRLAIDG